MNGIPLGYKLENGKLVSNEEEAKIVKLTYELYLAGIHEDDIKIVFNEFKVPKRITEGTFEVPVGLVERANDLMQERIVMDLARKKELSK